MAKNKYKNILTKDFFQKEYFEKNQTLNDIVRKYKIHIDTIRFYFHSLGFELRPASENRKLHKMTTKTLDAIKKAGLKRRKGNYFICKNCNKKYYIEPKLIQDNSNYCSFECQFENITFEDLKQKTYGPGHLKFIYKKLLTEDFFINNYVKTKKSFAVLCKENGIAFGTLFKYFNKYNLKRKTVSEVLKGREFSFEHRLKIREATKNGSFYSNIHFRSSWEANFAKWCDLSSIKWKYESKEFLLNINNKDTKYTPDFYLPEFDLWIEVKGRWIRDAQTKFQEFKKIYPNIMLFNKEALTKFGIINFRRYYEPKN
jgi:hypothetical protein